MNRILRTIQWSALAIGMTILIVVAGLTASGPAPAHAHLDGSDRHDSELWCNPDSDSPGSLMTRSVNEGGDDGDTQSLMCNHAEHLPFEESDPWTGRPISSSSYQPPSSPAS